MARKFIGIAIVALLLFSVLGLVACGNNTDEGDEKMDSITFEVGTFGGGFTGLNGDETFSAVVRSKQELISFFDGRSVSWSADTPIWNSYGETFFENKALVLYFFWATSTDFSFSVSDVKIDSGALKLDITGSHYGNALNDAMQFVPIVVEVAKNDINNANTVSLNIQYKDLQSN